MNFFSRFMGAARGALALVLALALLVPGLYAGAEEGSAYQAQLRFQLGGQDICLTLSADPKGLLLASQLQLTALEQNYANLGLYLGPEALVVEDTLLLDGTYGVNLQQLERNLPGSVFAPDSGSVLALGRGVYDALLGRTEDSVAVIGGADGPTAIFLTGSGLSGLAAALAQNVRMTVAPGKLELESGTILTTETTVQLGPQELASLGTQLRNLLGENSHLASLLSVLDGEEKSLTATVALDRKTRELVCASAALTSGANSLSFGAVVDGNVCTATLNTGSGRSLTAVLTLEEDSDSALDFQFYLTQGGAPNSRIRFHWDKTSGSYRITTEDQGRTDLLEGTLRVEGDSLEITADRANGQALEPLSLKLSRNAAVTIPTYREITTMTESEILSTLGSALATLKTIVGEALRGG